MTMTEVNVELIGDLSDCYCALCGVNSKLILHSMLRLINSLSFLLSKDRFFKNNKDSRIFKTHKNTLKIDIETNKFCMTKHLRFEHMELDLQSKKMLENDDQRDKKEWRDNDFFIRVKLK